MPRAKQPTESKGLSLERTGRRGWESWVGDCGASAVFVAIEKIANCNTLFNTVFSTGVFHRSPCFTPSRTWHRAAAGVGPQLWVGQDVEALSWSIPNANP